MPVNAVFAVKLFARINLKMERIDYLERFMERRLVISFSDKFRIYAIYFKGLVNILNNYYQIFKKITQNFDVKSL